MSELSGQYQKLPPGWDCKYDQTTGNCYYINYFTKVMQLEDPRTNYKQLQNERCSTESIPLQQMHGSGGSPYHVYPSNNPPAMRAFQPHNNVTAIKSSFNRSTSPLLSSRTQLQELSPVPFLKNSAVAQTPHLGNMSRRSTIQETSFTNQTETDAVVAKIQNMFPTASENHIRLLLKRYMKTIFPKADEMLLLDILANMDNNVQRASEQLITLGYVKRDFVAHKPNNRPPSDETRAEHEATLIPLRPKEYSDEEKLTMQRELKEKYPQIAEKIIVMALESVNYAEDRAIQILQIVQEEDAEQAAKQGVVSESAAGKQQKTQAHSMHSSNLDECQLDGPHAGGDKDAQRDSYNEDMPPIEQQTDEFQSLLGRIKTMGHNTQLAQGPDENLLLADYVTWNGANPDISLGSKQAQAQGADPSKLTGRSYKAQGRNPELCKGPQAALSKGSIYAQYGGGANVVGTSAANAANIKCN